MIRHLNVRTSKRTEFVDITQDIQALIDDSGIKEGVCYVYVPHTTAAVTINEGADPSVKRDILMMLEKLVPERAGYAHMEGNSDAHIKSSLIGASEVIIIEGGRLQLGTWQSVFFCEFDGPRHRRVVIKIVGD
ncbi:MAG: YjbQ family protein [Nitrospirae bacterium]|nr:YjbQ family protein [Nitrospirota bacterium]